jgi:PadR family transcriptional regulator AphA
MPIPPMLPLGAIYTPYGSMSQRPKLTTTSYVILGHLALRDWSTYELAQQMKRSTRHYWPRAESKIYEEPKKLVALGLADATAEFTGRRRRTVYRITANGRRALRAWLDEPSRPPVLEFEGLVKVLFAEHGSKDQTLRTIRMIREDAERNRDEHSALAADLAETGGPFPDRLHVNELVFEFMWQQTSTVIRWAEWAERQIAGWPDDMTLPTGAEIGSVVRAAAADRSA